MGNGSSGGSWLWIKESSSHHIVLILLGYCLFITNRRLGNTIYCNEASMNIRPTMYIMGIAVGVECMSYIQLEQILH